MPISLRYFQNWAKGLKSEIFNNFLTLSKPKKFNADICYPYFQNICLNLILDYLTA